MRRCHIGAARDPAAATKTPLKGGIAELNPLSTSSRFRGLSGEVFGHHHSLRSDSSAKSTEQPINVVIGQLRKIAIKATDRVHGRRQKQTNDLIHISPQRRNRL